MRVLLPLACLLLAAPVAAQAPGGVPDHLPGLHGTVEAGRYAVEPGHTQVAFAVSHMGISPFAGWFSGAGGTLTIDPADPSRASLDVNLPIASLQTTSAKLTEELNGADWFDAARFPTASFKSTGVTPLGGDAARIEGMLTLHGVTRPVVLTAKLFGAGTNAMDHKANIGFVGRIMLRRSDFGIAKYVPLVSDAVELVINAAFEREDTSHAKN